MNEINETAAQPVAKKTRQVKLLNPGDRFGRVVVIERLLKVAYQNRTCRVKCDCGNEKVVVEGSLHNGLTKSCGCGVREATSKRCKIHGETDHPDYRLWKGMKERCYYAKHKAYARYGGRGIQVCSKLRWEYSAFIALVGHRPTPVHSIDRKDFNGHYSCGACDECKKNGWPMNLQWSTDKQQANNRRGNRIVTVNGESHTVAEWTDKTGMIRTTLVRRLNDGIDPETAVTTPPLEPGKRFSPKK